MSESLILLISIVVAAAVGIFLGITYYRLKSQGEQGKLQERESLFKNQIDGLNAALEKLEFEREAIRREKEFVQDELTRKTTQLENLQEQNERRDEEIQKQQELLRKDFELLANKILEEKSSKFTERNKEELKRILNPLQEKIQTFEKKVEDTQKENISMHSALKQQLLGLKDLNLQMTKEATNLTKALKGDSKMQGNWGELVLERVLEKSGLEKGREYEIQQSFVTEQGIRVLPDVVIHLPDQKKMIIDSKVSLTDYERMVNTEDEIEKEQFLKAHLSSIKKHVDQLSEKNYQDLYDMESPDFVLMFVPIEPAFAIAVNSDSTLYNKAFERNIVIVTPATLLATLRTIDSMWSNDKQQRNAMEIARQAGALYDKFEGLLKDLTGVGKKIDAAKSDYSAAMNKLVEGRGNLITSVEKLKKMGAKAKKSLPDNVLKRAEEAE